VILLPVLLFQVALVFIIIHAVATAVQAARGARPDWFELAYQVAIIIVALWFLVQH
jgi:hypothetical protein